MRFMKARAAALVFGCFLAFATTIGGRDSGEVSRPDIFLVTIDTLRADHVQCYGYDRIQTPALNSLAKDGVLFNAAFTASPITNSSHATILTGNLPSTHGVSDFGIPLSANHPTWAELLKELGYHTAAFIGAVILDSRSLAPGFDRGFDFYDHFPERPTTTGRYGRVERRGIVVVKHAEDWLSRHPAGQRFVWLHLYDPHDPYDPPPPYSELYKDHLYDGEIAYADSALEDFLRYLKARGWYRRSLIIVVGDHGEGLGEHGEETHGIFLYDSTMHVPLIFKLPDAASAGTVSATQVSTTDILPTVMDLIAARPTDHFDGESFKPLLYGQTTDDRPAFGQTDYPLRFGWAPLRSLRFQGFKLIEAPRPEFYSLSTDPGELRDIYEPWNQTVQKFRETLAGVKDQTDPGSKQGKVGAGTVSELRALGYLGPEGSTYVPEPYLLPDPKDKIDEQNLLHVAMLAADAGRTADSRLALGQVLALDPQSAPALLQLGEIEFQAANYASAAEYLKKASALRPNDPEVSFDLGRALRRSNDLTGSRDALEASLHLNPLNLEGRILLGQVYMGLGNSEAARGEFEAALLLAPNDPDAHMNLGRALLANDNEAAVKELNIAAKLRPEIPEVYDLLSQAYANLGNKFLAGQASAHAQLLRRTKSP